MMPPQTPRDEETRIDTLRSLKVLDTSPEERFDRLTRVAKRLFGVPIALVSLVDTDRQWFKSCVGLDASETPRDISFCGHAILGNDIFLIPDATMDERFNDNPLVVDEPHIRFYAGCPLTVANGSRLGTLCIIDRDPREFDEEDLDLLRDLARMAEQELAAVQLATLDELTLISNRRGFTTLAAHTLAVCRRQDRPVTTLFFDLDRFKSINDRFGHAEGDRAIADFARLLRQTFRESDVLGRLGGDEFAVLLSDVDRASSQDVLARLRHAVAEHNTREQRGYEIAYSVGAVQFDPERHQTVEDVLEESDAAMYQHKHSRRSTDVAA